MLPEPLITLTFGTGLFFLGQRLGRVMLRKGATANDIFKGNPYLSIAFLGAYIGLLLVARLLPEMPALPLEWRFYSWQFTWTVMRLLLLLICGIAFKISWHTARLQVIAVVLISLLGVGSFTVAESYFLTPIYATLENNLQPNGVFKQTSNSSCGPSALATILRKWGINATESSVARAAGTSRLGTSMAQLLVATRSFGMDGMELKVSWEQMQQINRPGVLGIWSGIGFYRIPHAVALLGLNGDVAKIGDPTWGKIYNVNRARLEKVWDGQYLPIFRPENTLINRSQVGSFFQQLGVKITNDADLEPAIRRFQQSMGIQVTGELDPKTALLLSGAFLEGVPTLNGK